MPLFNNKLLFPEGYKRLKSQHPLPSNAQLLVSGGEVKKTCANFSTDTQRGKQSDGSPPQERPTLKEEVLEYTAIVSGVRYDPH